MLADRPVGFRAAQAAVRHDETRLFHVAVTRATERLVVTAVGNEDEQPSVYLDPSTRRRARGWRTRWRPPEVSRAMSLPGLVGELRREVVSPDPGVAEPALHLLAVAARAGGAEPTPRRGALRDLDERPPSACAGRAGAGPGRRR